MPKSIHQRKAEKRSARSRERARQNRRSLNDRQKNQFADTPFADIPTYISGFLKDSHSLVTNLMHLTKLINAALATVEKLYQKSGSSEDEKKLHIFQDYKDTLEKAKPHIAELYRRIGSIQDASTNAEKMSAIFETFEVFSEAGETFQNIMERFHEDNAIITGLKPEGDTSHAVDKNAEVEPVKDEPTEFEEVVEESVDGIRPVEQTETKPVEDIQPVEEAEIKPVEQEPSKDDCTQLSTRAAD